MKRPRVKKIDELNADCGLWNRLFPIGTTVKYHPVIGQEEGRIQKTKSEAFVLSGHTVCIFLENERGCVALEACEIVSEESANVQ